MRHVLRPTTSTLLAGAALAAALGCESPGRVLAPASAPDEVTLAAGADHGVAASATGGGHYLLQATFDVQFAFSAIQHASGKVMGRFHHSLERPAGTIDFHGEVTCLAFDPENHRAWIGGVITRNTSTDPAFQLPLHQPGHDVWFRVVDYGEGGNATLPDRTTFIGFENTPGIPTSAFYCATRPWPAGDERTWPVTAGNIQVR
ncbi:MAG TPA: hypothetical protein VNA89_07990 [Gemmatimonadaceae bacterium]|nr:hypothetical protein [Gemmatimonadaceae bacterium]